MYNQSFFNIDFYGGLSKLNKEDQCFSCSGSHDDCYALEEIWYACEQLCYVPHLWKEMVNNWDWALT